MPAETGDPAAEADAAARSGGLLPVTPNRTAVRRPPILFSWRPVTGAEAYEFVMADANGNTVVTAKNRVPQITYTADDLEAGQEYAWKVTARGRDSVLAEGAGRFFLLRPAALNKVGQAEKDLQARHGSLEAQASLTARALLYQKFQLNDEAREVLTKLRQAHPGNTRIIGQLKALQNNYRP
jgi:hypothetical protein